MREDNKSISQTDVCDSNDVKYMTDNGDDIAYVTASYFIKTAVHIQRHIRNMYCVKMVTETGKYLLL